MIETVLNDKNDEFVKSRIHQVFGVWYETEV